jgi:hypothetical protein
LNIYFGEPSQNKLSASHIYAWKLGLKTGQYYLRSRPARDAIQFTLDVDALDAKEDGNYNTKNLSKAEMDAAKRLARKRPAPEPVESKVVAKASTDLNKKRKTTDEAPATTTQKEDKSKETKEAKPWEGKEEQEVDYRWDICENCQ